MGWFSSDIDTFDELFVHTLQDIYYAEHQILKALPDMVKKASDPGLKKGFSAHLKQTKGQVKRLDRVFKMIKSIPQGTKCPAIDGIIEEANEIAGEIEDKVVLNAALIAAAQAVEHYEITRYGTLVAWAKVIGRNDVAKLLSMTLEGRKSDRQEIGRDRQEQDQPKGCSAETAEAGPDRARGKRFAERSGRYSGDLTLAAGRALRIDVERIERMRGRHEQAVALDAAKTNIGAALRQ